LLIERQESQKPLLRLSSNSALVVAQNSAHHIPDEAPDTVIRAVRAVVEGARTGERMSEPSIRGSVEARHAGE
jgi:hypothetical protein